MASLHEVKGGVLCTVSATKIIETVLFRTQQIQNRTKDEFSHFKSEDKR